MMGLSAIGERYVRFANKIESLRIGRLCQSTVLAIEYDIA